MSERVRKQYEANFRFRSYDGAGATREERALEFTVIDALQSDDPQFLREAQEALFVHQLDKGNISRAAVLAQRLLPARDVVACDARYLAFTAEDLSSSSPSTCTREHVARAYIHFCDAGELAVARHIIERNSKELTVQGFHDLRDSHLCYEVAQAIGKPYPKPTLKGNFR